MAFRSAADALASRRAVAGLMGLASAQGFFALSSDHHDLTPAVAGKAPLAPGMSGGRVPAPDIVILGSLPGIVIGVEVETRQYSKQYPASTFVEFAKLRDNLEVQISSAVYARHLRGSSFDLDNSWRQQDIRSIMRDHDAGFIDFLHPRTGEKLLILSERDLARLDALWLRLRGAV